METATFIGIALILSGAVVMGASLHRFRPLLGALPLVAEPTRSWLRRLIRAHGALTLFFLAGYLASAVAFALKLDFVGHVFVGLIFALGAVFVYLGLSIQTRLVREIVKTMGQFVPICEAANAFVSQIGVLTTWPPGGLWRPTSPRRTAQCSPTDSVHSALPSFTRSFSRQLASTAEPTAGARPLEPAPFVAVGRCLTSA